MPRKYKPSTENPRKPAPSVDDLLKMLKAIKLEKKSANAVAKQFDYGKSSLYDLVKEYDKQMGKDEVTEKKLQTFLESKKSSGGQTVN